jgi:hypothetical protein
MKHYVEKQCFRDGRISWVPMKDSVSDSEQFARGYLTSILYIGRMRDLRYRIIREDGETKEVLQEI